MDVNRESGQFSTSLYLWYTAPIRCTLASLSWADGLQDTVLEEMCSELKLAHLRCELWTRLAAISAVQLQEPADLGTLDVAQVCLDHLALQEDMQCRLPVPYLQHFKYAG